MYARGYEHGTRRQTRQASRWYDAIAEATLARLDATWPETNSTPQEVTNEHTQGTGTRDQGTGIGTKSRD